MFAMISSRCRSIIGMQSTLLDDTLPIGSTTIWFSGSLTFLAMSLACGYHVGSTMTTDGRPLTVSSAVSRQLLNVQPPQLPTPLTVTSTSSGSVGSIERTGMTVQPPVPAGE